MDDVQESAQSRRPPDGPGEEFQPWNIKEVAAKISGFR